jgi:Flp pilus assembly pilin Flp
MRKGQALVEYALILALVSIISITVLFNLGQSVKNVLTKVNTALNIPVSDNCK